MSDETKHAYEVSIYWRGNPSRPVGAELVMARSAADAVRIAEHRRGDVDHYAHGCVLARDQFEAAEAARYYEEQDRQEEEARAEWGGL